VETAGRLRVRSFLIDGEAVACDGDGLPVFDQLRYRRDDRRVFLYAFDLIELNGEDLRREPVERCKAALAKLLGQVKAGLLLNEHIDEPVRHRRSSANPRRIGAKTGGDEEAPYQRTSSKRQAADRIRSAAEELVAGVSLNRTRYRQGEQADKMKDILGRVYEYPLCAEWNR